MPAASPSSATRFPHWVHWVALAVILAVAALVRVAHLWSTAERDPFFFDPAVDPALYLAWAKEILAGEAPREVFFLSPGYAYALAGAVALVGDDLFRVRALHAVLGWVGVALVYAVGRQAFGRRAALVAASFAAVYAPLVFYEQELLPAALQGPLSTAAVLFLLRARAREQWIMWGLGGACLGLASIARPNLLIACGLCAVWIAWLGVRRHLSRPRVLLAAAAFIGGCALPIVPVALHNQAAGDAVLISSSGGHNFYIGNGPDATGRFVVPRPFASEHADDPTEQRRSFTRYAEEEVGAGLRPSEVSRFYYGLSWAHIQEHPLDWLALLGRKTLLFVNHYEAASSRDFDSSRRFSAVLSSPLPTAGALLPLALAGLCLVLWRGPRPAPLLFVIAAHAVSAVAYFSLAHYRLPAAPLLCALAAYAVDRAVSFGLERRWKRLAALGLAVGLFVPVVHLDLDNPAASRFMVHYNLGNRFRSRGSLDAAVAEYRESLRLRPDYLSARNNLALALEARPEAREEAIAEWRQLRKLAEARSDALYIERATRHLLVLEQAPQQKEQP